MAVPTLYWTHSLGYPLRTSCVFPSPAEVISLSRRSHSNTPRDWTLTIMTCLGQSEPRWFAKPPRTIWLCPVPSYSQNLWFHAKAFDSGTQLRLEKRKSDAPCVLAPYFYFILWGPWYPVIYTNCISVIVLAFARDFGRLWISVHFSLLILQSTALSYFNFLEINTIRYSNL